MSLAGEDRKIQSPKFYVTLPQDWRESHGLKPGQTITAHYRDKSPLIIVPKGAQLSPLDIDLITLLVEGPSVSKVKDLIEKFGAMANVFEAVAAQLYKIEEGVCPVGS